MFFVLISMLYPHMSIEINVCKFTLYNQCIIKVNTIMYLNWVLYTYLHFLNDVSLLYLSAYINDLTISIVYTIQEQMYFI